MLIKKFTEDFSKSDDTYELIEKKIEEDALKKFYLFMLDKTDITPNDLEVKNGSVILLSDNLEIKVPGFSYALTNFRFYPEKILVLICWALRVMKINISTGSMALRVF